MGPKAKKFMRKLRTGVSIEESTVILQEVTAEKAREDAPRKNPFKWNDPVIQRLSDLWFSQRRSATVDQKNSVGIAYISNVLNLGDKIAEKFLVNDWEVQHTVGLIQAGCTNYHPDLKRFWLKVNSIFPGVYSPEDLDFLIKKCGTEAARHLLWQIEIPLAEQSPILRLLAQNAHAYK